MLTGADGTPKHDTCGSDLGIRWPSVERVTGIEPALSAWEVCGATRLPPDDL